MIASTSFHRYRAPCEMACFGSCCYCFFSLPYALVVLAPSLTRHVDREL